MKLTDAASPTRGFALEHGCDAVVVQAAASAHDLGHPPFGHLGERVLDRLARETLGLGDGFEGNAQSYRILTALDVSEAAPRGLNLTAAVRTAVAKYPWTRYIDGEAVGDGPLPRGLRRTAEGVEALKFSAYGVDALDLAEARAGLPTLQQSLECSVMDIADDIAYSIHDVDDFYRAGLLSQGDVAREFRGWIDAGAALGGLEDEALAARTAPPGSALEGLRRKLRRSDPGWQPTTRSPTPSESSPKTSSTASWRVPSTARSRRSGRSRRSRTAGSATCNPPWCPHQTASCEPGS